MWEDNLKKVIDEKKMYDEEVNSGASKEEIARLIEEANKKLNVEIPKEYLDIISKINGIEFNGFILYGVPKEYLDIISKINGIEFNGFILYGVDEYLLEHQINQSIYGLVDSNQIWYENEEQKKYLFLGESNISWYVYEYKKKCFIELDNPSGRESNKFNSFYEIFNKILIDAAM